MENKLTIKAHDSRVIALSKADNELYKLINIIGNYSVDLQTNYFESLVKKIIGQQLSVKSAGTIIGRVSNLCQNNFTPDILLKISDEKFRAAGVSHKKILYLKDLCIKIISGELNFDDIVYKEDDAVINNLIKVKGIGEWTAEMFLIFSLGRLDVLSFGDVGLQRGIRWLYKLDKNESIDFTNLKNRWSPYNTIASLYLWEIVNRNIIHNFKDIDEMLKYESEKK